MNNSNFTKTEIANLANAISVNTSLSMRVNKMGNLDVKHKDSDTLHFVFYKNANGEYFVRRRTWVGNGRGINQHGTIMFGKRTFKTMNDLIKRFARYMDEYPTNLAY